MNSTSPESIRFAADIMVGRLARWLRVLGYDTFYDVGCTGPELVSLAREENRIVLTRNRRLATELEPGGVLLLKHQSPKSQLEDVVRRFRLGFDWIFTRCVACNRVVKEANADEVASLVPARLRQAPTHFYRCPGCGKVYWEGSHRKRFEEFLERILNQNPDSN